MGSGGCCWPGPAEPAVSIATCCAPRSTLAAADGASNAAIGRTLGVTDDTVRKWRRRFCQHGLDGLRDQPRTGRPRRFPATVVAEVKALTCELPADSDVPLAKWSCPALVLEAARRGIVESVAASTVRRWLTADALKPWQHRSWIYPRDPDFAVKAAYVCSTSTDMTKQDLRKNGDGRPPRGPGKVLR